MFQVLQRPGMPGVTVSAFDLKKNEAVWQTWLAAPLVAEPMLGPVSGKLTAVTASGGMFRAPPDGLKPLDKPWEPVLAIDSEPVDEAALFAAAAAGRNVRHDQRRRHDADRDL